MCDHVCIYLIILELNRLWLFNKTIVTKMLKHLKFYLLQDDFIHIYICIFLDRIKHSETHPAIILLATYAILFHNLYCPMPPLILGKYL